jgi:hypothetical protein
MVISMRLGGTIAGASIIIEPPEFSPSLGPTSGFASSIMIGGVDHRAGALGHIPIDRSLIAALNERSRSFRKQLAPLVAVSCSCTPEMDPAPGHLEAYTAGAALARRVRPGEPVGTVVRRIIEDPDRDIHRLALADAGELVGHALLGPAAMLSPTTITLTGALAVPTVRDEVARYISAGQPFGVIPEVTILEGDENRFVAAKGAALAVLRGLVYRRLESLLGSGVREASDHVRALTMPMREPPW